MELTNEELKAKLTEGVLLLERWTLLWANVADSNAILEVSATDSPKKRDWRLCSTESIDYIRSLES